MGWYEVQKNEWPVCVVSGVTCVRAFPRCFVYISVACHPTMCSMSFNVDHSKHPWNKNPRKKRKPMHKRSSYLLRLAPAICFNIYNNTPLCCPCFLLRLKMPSLHLYHVIIFLAHRVQHSFPLLVDFHGMLLLIILLLPTHALALSPLINHSRSKKRGQKIMACCTI